LTWWLMLDVRNTIGSGAGTEDDVSADQSISCVDGSGGLSEEGAVSRGRSVVFTRKTWAA